MAIYLDNAATSYPKPKEVYNAVDYVLRNVGGNPGRAGHKMSLEANRIILEARERIAKLFNIPDESRIIFTSNATEAINLGIKGVLQCEDHVVTTTMEHNSVLRPLKALESIGVKTTKVQACSNGSLPISKVEQSLQKNTKLMVVTHASNVVGYIYPLHELGWMAKKKGIIFMVDAAQTAGEVSIDVQAMGIDLLACPGHKGLLGPQGTGFLYMAEGIDLRPLVEGGTGSFSESEDQPQILPDRFESGTLNTPGIAGLAEGVQFILSLGIENIRKHKLELISRLREGLKEIEGIALYGPGEGNFLLTSLDVEGWDPSELGFILDHFYDIQVRTGLHCAPLAHKSITTFPRGTIRVSPGYFNTPEDIDNFLIVLKEILSNKSKRSVISYQGK